MTHPLFPHLIFVSIRSVVKEQSAHPQKYVAEYDQFLYLIDGGAEQEVELYIKVSSNKGFLFCGNECGMSLECRSLTSSRS